MHLNEWERGNRTAIYLNSWQSSTDGIAYSKLLFKCPTLGGLENKHQKHFNITDDKGMLSGCLEDPSAG